METKGKFDITRLTFNSGNYRNCNKIHGILTSGDSSSQINCKSVKSELSN